MNDLSRREILLGDVASAAALGVSAAASAAAFGNPDSPAEGRINGRSPTSLDDPGPQNPALANQFPSFQDPPATANVTDPYLPRPLSSIQMTGSTMARTVADQFAEVLAAAGGFTLYMVKGNLSRRGDEIVDLARTVCGASGKLP
jgi:hypothetical protein